jgi:hypothetical protein
MRSFVFVLFLVFQTAFACTPIGDWGVVAMEIPSWLDGTAENLIFLEKQGIIVDFYAKDNDPENLENVIDGSMHFEIPALKINLVTRIHPSFSIEEQLIMNLIRESKWNFTYTGWSGAIFKIGDYKIKMFEYSNPFDILHYLLDDKIEKELGTKNLFLQLDQCGSCDDDICYQGNSIEYENKTEDLIISITFTGKFTRIQFLPPNSVSELYFASPFLFFASEIKNFEFFRNQNNERVGVTFLFKLTKNIDMNQKILEFIPPKTTKYLRL